MFVNKIKIWEFNKNIFRKTSFKKKKFMPDMLQKLCQCTYFLIFCKLIKYD